MGTRRILSLSLIAVTCYLPFGLLASAPLTNGDIVKLLKAGMSDDVILATIEANGAKFDTSANALILLKRNGASDRLVHVVLETRRQPPSANSPSSKNLQSTQNTHQDGALAPANARPAVAASGRDCQPESPDGHLLLLAEGKRHVLGFKRADMAQSTSVLSVLATTLTLGIAPTRGTSSAVLRGARSGLRVPGQSIEFRDLSTRSGEQPSESVYLLRASIENGQRIVQLADASMSITSGAQVSQVPRADQIYPMEYVPTSESCNYRGQVLSIYSARPLVPLPPGEYVIYSTNAGLNLYDFGVD